MSEKTVQDRESISRRRILSAFGAIATVSIAGCIIPGSGGDDNETNETNDTGGNVPSEPSEPDAPNETNESGGDENETGGSDPGENPDNDIDGDGCPDLTEDPEIAS